MADAFFFVGLPYLALGVLVMGTIYRFTRAEFSVSALSSQALEDRLLRFGSIPWHLGIFIVLGGHLITMAIPAIWQGLVGERSVLLTVETVGVASALLCAVGLSVLLVRRVTASKLQSVTTKVDLIVLGLLLAQVVLGLTVALTQRWGASWSTGTTTPYMWSLLTLQPDMGYVVELPPVVKLHLVLAWCIFLLAPFSRLVHAFSVPLTYLVRSPQKVLWATQRRFAHEKDVVGVQPGVSRRHLLRGLAGVSGAAALMSVGVADKLIGFFRGPNLDEEQKAERLGKRLDHLESESAQTSLELERTQQESIQIASMGELQSKVGRYFIDYQMRPALAFLDDATGLPILISAKCTHLGCTVGNTVNDEGRILCPCHISFFDLKTGVPTEGPAKDPLEHLRWVIRNEKDQILAQLDENGEVVGDLGALEPSVAGALTVHIVKPEAL